LLTTSGTRPYNMCTEEFSDLKMKKKWIIKTNKIKAVKTNN
jgi:hypothetical protein